MMQNHLHWDTMEWSMVQMNATMNVVCVMRQ